MENDPGTTPPDEDAYPALQDACNAAAAYVENIHPTYLVDDVFSPPADIMLGAVMYAARLFERRGSVLGVSGFSEFGGGILRYDPDIARLLRIGPHTKFVFGAPALPVEEEETV